MSVFFISDLHLRSPEEKVAKLLKKFLAEVPASGDAVVLGGDLFDLFVGNKEAFTKPFESLIRVISRLGARGVAVHYAEGNHDFQLKNVFGDTVMLHEDSFSLEVDGVKIWVAHGDRIDPEDRGYHLLRFVTRSLPVRGLICALPNKLLRQLGEWSSRQSRKYNRSDRLPAELVARTKMLFREYAERRWTEGFDWVFLGHSHLADHWELGPKAYINLGYSEEALLYARGAPEKRQLTPMVYSG